jgi:acylphosphatase
MSTLSSCYILVKGRVQGVGFRYYASHLAESLGLKGYVRNLDTGEVEIEMEGDKEIITGFLDELRQGKMKNYISNLEIQWGDYQHKYDGFAITF